MTGLVYAIVAYAILSTLLGTYTIRQITSLNSLLSELGTHKSSTNDD